MKGLKEGLTKKEGFTPSKSSPGTTGKMQGDRPKSDNDKLKRRMPGKS